VVAGELVAGAHRELGRRLSSLGDLLVAQLQLRLQIVLWEERKEVNPQGTPGEERAREQGHPKGGEGKPRAPRMPSSAAAG